MAKRAIPDAEILAQIPAARRRAALAQRTQPHAAAVRYDPARRAVRVALTNGALLTIPVALLPTLHGASDRDLREVRAGPAGVGLRWERLDMDLSVAGLAEAALGRTTLLRAAGAAGGAVRSPKKARAARLNGLKGGRPARSRAG